MFYFIIRQVHRRLSEAVQASSEDLKLLEVFWVFLHLYHGSLYIQSSKWEPCLRIYIYTVSFSLLQSQTK